MILHFVGNPSLSTARVALPVRQPVAAGATVGLTLRTRLPNNPGPVGFAFRMFSPAIGLFGAPLTGSTTVDGAATAAFDASLVSESFPGMMAPNAPELATVTLQNDGTSTWAADGTVLLHALTNPIGLFNLTQRVVTTPVPPGGQHTFTVPIRAPATPGSYTHLWRMFSTTATYFGPTIDVPVTVSGATTPSYDGALVQQVVPAQLDTNARTTFTVEYQNTGSQAWAPGDVVLLSANSPYGLWGGTIANPLQLGTVQPGASAVFDVRVVAPASPGAVASAWRLFATDGTGYFGPTASAPVNVVVPTPVDAGVPDSGAPPDAGAPDAGHCAQPTMIPPQGGYVVARTSQTCTTGFGCAQNCTSFDTPVDALLIRSATQSGGAEIETPGIIQYSQWDIFRITQTGAVTNYSLFSAQCSGPGFFGFGTVQVDTITGALTASLTCSQNTPNGCPTDPIRYTYTMTGSYLANLDSTGCWQGNVNQCIADTCSSLGPCGAPCLP